MYDVKGMYKIINWNLINVLYRLNVVLFLQVLH
jgi:hypothetical protein